MLILQLMIAHLLGDFVFQSNKLIKEKYAGWFGTFKHVCIIAACSIIALFPYLGTLRAWIVIAIIFAVHFSQDLLKVEYDKFYNKDKSPLPFFADQALHLLLIFYLGRGFVASDAFALPTWLMELHGSQTLAAVLVGLVLISYTFDITVYQFKRHKKKKLSYHPDYVGMLQRLLAFTIFYLLFFALYLIYLVA